MIPRRLNKGEKFGSLFVLWNQLIDHLHSMRLVAGKGIRISRHLAGTVIEALPPSRTGGGNAVNTLAGGSFIVELSAVEKAGQTSYSLTVGKGFANINGKTLLIAKQENIAIEKGLLCLCAEINTADGSIKYPEFKFAQFSENNYPLAEISQDQDGNYLINQYPVTVATFMLTKACVFAQGENYAGQ